MRLDLIGQTFGRLTVIGQGTPQRYPSGGVAARWICKCVCGNQTLVSTQSLRSGNTQSCGCLQKERVSASAKIRNRKHGMSSTSEYKAWLHMKYRCYDPKCEMYYRYGGRGIRVCDAWLNSFEAFYAYLGPRPSSSHSIGRLDHNKGYEPGNVRWESIMQQGERTSRTHEVTINGVTKHASQWCREFGIDTGSFYTRVNKLGWNEVKALTTPVRESRTKSQKLIYNGQPMTLKQIANITGIPYQTLHSRIKRGRTLEEAINL